MKILDPSSPSESRGFSFIEVLAAIAIIGIVTFLAIPNLIQIKEDGEDKLALSRAEALNMAIASYVQANGKTAAWPGTDDARYTRLTPYLAFAPSARADYIPAGYTFHFPTNLTTLSYSNMVYATKVVGTSTNRIE